MYLFWTDDSCHGHSSTELKKVVNYFYPILFLPLLLKIKALSFKFFVLYIIFSDWGVDLLDSICDGHVDCNDLLTSITGSSILSLFMHVYVCICLLGHGHLTVCVQSAYGSMHHAHIQFEMFDGNIFLRSILQGIVLHNVLSSQHSFYIEISMLLALVMQVNQQ